TQARRRPRYFPPCRNMRTNYQDSFDDSLLDTAEYILARCQRADLRSASGTLQLINPVCGVSGKSLLPSILSFNILWLFDLWRLWIKKLSRFFHRVIFNRANSV